MSIQGIQAVTAVTNMDSSLAPQYLSLSESNSSEFTSLLLNKVQQTNESMETSNKLFEMYLKGDGVAVHDVMIAMGKAKSELHLMVEIRNKVLDAYQEITRIQI